MNRHLVSALAALAAFFVLAIGGSAADSFQLRILSQTNSTITLGWDPQPGYGYLFSADGQVVSRTNDAARASVKFSKSYSTYEVAVIVKGATGVYPPAAPPPPPPPPPPAAACANGVDDDADGKIDLADPGCSSSTDTDETDPAPPPPPPSGCDLNATTATFAAQVNAAAPGQSVCLASGNYGTWGGTNKAITVKAASGATPQMQISFGSGDSAFTLDGMTGMAGGISNGAVNITISHSVFTGILNISGSGTDGIVLDGNIHNWQVGPSTGANAKLYLENSLTGTLAAPSVTVRNSQFKNGDLDGIHFGGGSGYQILNNTFDNLCDQGANHTDNMQFDTSVTTQVRIAGNYVHATAGCGTQGITSYDHGTSGVVIENNVVDIRRPWGIELYADVGSTVRHNTLVYYSSSNCDFNTPCGRIDINGKSADPASTGTQVYDNLAVAELNRCSTGCSAHHNVSSNGAVYVGPTTFHDGFLLAAGSVGKGAASDGTDAGVYRTG